LVSAQWPIRPRKAIYEELHPETKHGGDRKSDQVANSGTRFTADTADGTGKSERSIQIAAARGEALGDDLNAIAGTPNGCVFLKRLPELDNHLSGSILRASSWQTGQNYPLAGC
jgi:hypothetical protein